MSQFVISDADKELLTVFGLYSYFEEYIKVLGIYEKRSTLDRVVTTLTQAHNYDLFKADTKKIGLVAMFAPFSSYLTGNVNKQNALYLQNIHDHLNDHQKVSDVIVKDAVHLMSSFKRYPIRKPRELELRILLDSLYYCILSNDDLAIENSRQFIKSEHIVRYGGKDVSIYALRDSLITELLSHTWFTNAFATKAVLNSWSNKIEKCFNEAYPEFQSPVKTKKH